MFKKTVNYNGGCQAYVIQRLTEDEISQDITNIKYKGNKIHFHSTVDLDNVKVSEIQTFVDGIQCSDETIFVPEFQPYDDKTLAKAEIVFESFTGEVFSSVNIKSITRLKSNKYRFEFIQPFKNLNYSFLGSTHMEQYKSFYIRKAYNKTLNAITVQITNKSGYKNVTALIFMGEV